MLKLQKSYFLTNKSELRVDGGLSRLEPHRQSISRVGSDYFDFWRVLAYWRFVVASELKWSFEPEML
jgi:hypothetical protein